MAARSGAWLKRAFMSSRPLSAALAAICLTGSAPLGEPIETMQFEQRYDDPTFTPPRRLFISGHSLTDRPLPDFLEEIASHAGRRLTWSMQHLAGSSIMDRIPGATASMELQTPREDEGRALPASAGSPHPSVERPWDSLIITERHTLLESLVWDDTIGQAADFVARFRAGSANSRIYLFASWLNINRRDDPARWLAYEAAAGRAWRCTARGVERILSTRGEMVRIKVIPAAEALAGLVAASTKQWRRSGVFSNARRTVDLLFADDVHLTRAGTYFIALITHGALHGELPPEPWAPADVDPGLAAELQRFARQFLLAHMRTSSDEDPSACRTWFRRVYIPHYLSYVRDARWRREGTARAYLKWVRYRLVWPQLLNQDVPVHPTRSARRISL